ncbi:hypothetical protein ACKN7S_38955 [Bradyrhizobium sp. RDM4]
MSWRSHDDQDLVIRETHTAILAMGFALCALAVFIRGTISYYPITTYWDARWIAREALHRSYYDVMTVSCATASAAVALHFVRRSPRSQRVVVGIYYVFAGLMGLLFCINSRALEVIGGSLTYQWLYYADLFPQFYFSICNRFEPGFFYSVACCLVIFSADCSTARSQDFASSNVGLPIISFYNRP